MMKNCVIIIICSIFLSGCFGSGRMLEKQKLASMTTDQKIDYLINKNNRLQRSIDDTSDDVFMDRYFPSLTGRR